MNILFLIKDPHVNERFGVMCLAAVARREGHAVRAIDPSVSDFNKLVSQIQDFNTEILAYSTETGPHDYYLELNRKIKERMDIFSIMGGPHPTFFPKVLEEEKSLDAICIGEGEDAFKELLSKLSNKQDYTRTKNLWFRSKNGDLIKNEIRDLVDDLDSLPFPERDIFSRYKARYSTLNEWSFLIGRGCPFGCTYCFNHSYNAMYKGKGKIIRKRSVSNIIEEIKNVRKDNNMTFVTFIDDNFILGSKEWLEEFSRRYPKEVGLPFRIALNPSTADDYTLKILKEAGCFSVSIGIEAGNEEVRKKVLNRDITNERIIQVCRLLKKCGIKILTQNMVGLPVKNTYEHDLETLRLNQLCRPDFAWASIFYPFPKTVLGEFAFSNDYVSRKGLSSVKSYMLKSALNYDSEMEKRKVENLHKLFGIATEYPFLNPIINFLVKVLLYKVYVFIFFAWYGFCDKYRVQNERLSLRSLLKYTSGLFAYLRGLLETTPSTSLEK